VQGHRFNIYGDVGCFPFTYNVWPAYLLVSCWPIAIGLVSAVYCSKFGYLLPSFDQEFNIFLPRLVLSIRAFARRRSQFKELLSANSNLNANRYFRLMFLAGIEVACTIPLASWAMYLNIHTIHLFPYKGWADTHWGFSRVDQFPTLLWHNNRLLAMSLELTRWSPVVCAYVFFIFFGFADEARKHYRLAYTSVAKRMGYTVTTSSSGFTSSSSNGYVYLYICLSRHRLINSRCRPKKSFPFMSSIGNGGLPIFVRKEATATSTTNRDSLGSFTLTIADAGGLLEDCKSPIYSPTESTSSSSQTYLPSPSETETPSLPLPPALPRPEPTLDLSSPIRISSDASSLKRSLSR
jgi:pheromone a factor receptor